MWARYKLLVRLWKVRGWIIWCYSGYYPHMAQATWASACLSSPLTKHSFSPAITLSDCHHCHHCRLVSKDKNPHAVHNPDSIYDFSYALLESVIKIKIHCRRFHCCWHNGFSVKNLSVHLRLQNAVKTDISWRKISSWLFCTSLDTSIKLNKTLSPDKQWMDLMEILERHFPCLWVCIEYWPCVLQSRQRQCVGEREAGHVNSEAGDCGPWTRHTWPPLHPTRGPGSRGYVGLVTRHAGRPWRSEYGGRPPFGGGLCRTREQCVGRSGFL